MLNFVLHTPTQGGTRGTPENLLDMVARARALGVPWEDLRDQRHLDGPDAAADDHDRDGDGLQRPRRDGGQRALPPRRAAATTTRSWSSARCGSPTELDRPIATPAQARELLALRGREDGALPEVRGELPAGVRA